MATTWLRAIILSVYFTKYKEITNIITKGVLNNQSGKNRERGICVCKTVSTMGLRSDKSKQSWKMGSGAWVSLWSRGQSPPKPPGCLILDLQTLHIPTNKKLEVWTQYSLLLSLVATLLSKNFESKGDLYKILKYDRPATKLSLPLFESSYTLHNQLMAVSAYCYVVSLTRR